MLTNKNRFVKGIALVLAVLMVLAVCLTGCTDADAQAAATKAQETADAAKSAAEAANKAADDAKTAADGKTTLGEAKAAITAALGDYLKSADALKTSDIQTLIDKSLEGYAKSSDISFDGYAKTADVNNLLNGYTSSKDFTALKTDLENKLGTKIDAEEVKKALESYATKEDLTKVSEKVDEKVGEVNEKLAEENKQLAQKVAELEGKLAEYAKLEDVYTKQEIDDKFTEINKYFKDLTATEVYNVLTWALQYQYDVDYEDGEQLYEADGVTPVKVERQVMGLEMWNDVTDVVFKTIESLQVLYAKVQRQGYLQANIDLINNTMTEAFNLAAGLKFYDMVNGTAEDNAKITKLLEYRILRCATMDEIKGLAKAAEDCAAVHNFTDDWTELLKGVDDDALYTEKDYVYDAANNKKVNVSTIYNKDAYHAFSEKLDAMLTAYNTDTAAPLETKDDYAKYVKPVYYVSGSSIATTPADSSYKATVAVVGGTVDLLPADKDADTVYSLVSLGTPFLNIASTDANTAKYGTIITADLSVYEGEELALLKYDLIGRQIENCQTAVNTADDVFEKFVRKVLNYTGAYKDKGSNFEWDDAVALLKAYMIEDSCAPNPNLMDVQVAKNAATLINGLNGEDGTTYPEEGTWEGAWSKVFDNYFLYRKLCAAAFEKLVQRYQAKAMEMLTTIHNDYYSAVLECVKKAEAADYDTACLSGTATVVAALAAAKIEGCTGEDFLDKFFNGGTQTWVYANNAGKTGLCESIPSFTFPGLAAMNKDLVSYNGSVELAIKNIAENSVNMTTELGAAIVKARTDIYGYDINNEVDGKTSGKSPKVVFDDELQQAVNSLTEVVYRFIIDAMKDACIENLNKAVTDLVDIYVKEDTGVKASDIATLKAKITEAAKGYIYVDDAVEATITFELSDLYGLDVAVVKNLLKEIDAEAIEKIDIKATGITNEGETAMKAIDTIYNDAYNVIENFVIRCCIQYYISEAKTNVLAVWNSWTKAVKTDIDLGNDLTTAITNVNNQSLNEISIIEYIVSKKKFDFMESKEMYGKILSIVADKNIASVVDKVLGEDAYAGLYGEVTCYGLVKDLDATNDPDFVPVAYDFAGATLDVVADLDDTFVGSAVVNIDNVVNK